MSYTTKPDKKYDDETINLITKLVILKLMSRAKQAEKETGGQPA